MRANLFTDASLDGPAGCGAVFSEVWNHAETPHAGRHAKLAV